MKFKRIIFLTLVIVLLSSSIVLADIGPKPGITVNVENLPYEEYHLDLFINEEYQDNFIYLEKENHNPKILKHLEENVDGWRSATVYGTRTPLHFEDLKGELEGDKRVHRFSYVGTPKIFKIAIATENGLKLSEKIERTNYQSTYVLDFQEFMENGKVVGGGLRDYNWKIFFMTLVLTLIIEGIVFKAFKFNFKVDGLVFLLGNIITQLGLHYYLMRVGYNIFLLVPGEILVIAVETVLYTLTFKDGTKSRKIAYGIVANLASTVIGVMLWRYGFF